MHLGWMECHVEGYVLDLGVDPHTWGDLQQMRMSLLGYTVASCK